MKLETHVHQWVRSSAKVSGSWRKLCFSSQFSSIRGSMQAGKCFSSGQFLQAGRGCSTTC